MDPDELAGMTMERNAVMTATSVHAPPHPNTEAVFRTLEGDADWQQSLKLSRRRSTLVSPAATSGP